MTALTHTAKATLNYLTKKPADLQKVTLRANSFFRMTVGEDVSMNALSAVEIELRSGPVRATIGHMFKKTAQDAYGEFWDLSADQDVAASDLKGLITLSVSMDTKTAAADAQTSARVLLAGLASALAAADLPDCVQWLEPTAWVGGSEFLRVLAPAKPQRPERPISQRRARPVPGNPYIGGQLSKHAIIVEQDQKCATLGDLRLRHRDLRNAFRANDATIANETSDQPTQLDNWVTDQLDDKPNGFFNASRLASLDITKGARTAAHLSAISGLMMSLSANGALAMVATVIGV